MANIKEFTRLMNRLDDLQERITGIEIAQKLGMNTKKQIEDLRHEAKEIRHEVNLAVIRDELTIKGE